MTSELAYIVDLLEGKIETMHDLQRLKNMKRFTQTEQGYIIALQEILSNIKQTYKIT